MTNRNALHIRIFPQYKTKSIVQLQLKRLFLLFCKKGKIKLAFINVLKTAVTSRTDDNTVFTLPMVLQYSCASL